MPFTYQIKVHFIKMYDVPTILKINESNDKFRLHFTSKNKTRWHLTKVSTNGKEYKVRRNQEL